MYHYAKTTILLLAVFSLTSATLADTAATTKPATSATKPAPADTQPAKIDEVAVTINNQAIMESDIDAKLSRDMKMPLHGKNKMESKRYENTRQRVRQQVIDRIIKEKLLQEDLVKNNITVTDADLDAKIDELINNLLESRSWTLEEFEAFLQKQPQKMTLEKLKSNTKTDPSLNTMIQRDKLIAAAYPGEFKIKDKDIEEYYQKNLETRYKKPDMVKASHILIGTKEMTDEDKATARKKAEGILADAKKEGADFAALAQQHSSCPSKAKGGDLGFFPRKGQMVEPFAAAAFALKVGEISDIVETQFGYHIIKVTEKKKAETTPLDKAKGSIRKTLTQNKTKELMEQHMDKLMKSAKIVYPKGKEPKVETRPAVSLTTAPATNAAPATKPAK